eukprot:ctg_227.g117
MSMREEGVAALQIVSLFRRVGRTRTRTHTHTHTPASGSERLALRSLQSFLALVNADVECTAGQCRPSGARGESGVSQRGAVGGRATHGAHLRSDSGYSGPGAPEHAGGVGGSDARVGHGDVAEALCGCGVYAHRAALQHGLHDRTVYTKAGGGRAVIAVRGSRSGYRAEGGARGHAPAPVQAARARRGRHARALAGDHQTTE